MHLRTAAGRALGASPPAPVTSAPGALGGPRGRRRNGGDRRLPRDCPHSQGKGQGVRLPDTPARGVVPTAQLTPCYLWDPHPRDPRGSGETPPASEAALFLCRPLSLCARGSRADTGLRWFSAWPARWSPDPSALRSALGLSSGARPQGSLGPDSSWV